MPGQQVLYKYARAWAAHGHPPPTMIVPAASALLFAGAVAGSGNALFSRQDSGRSDGIVQLDSTSSWFIPSLNITLGTPGKVLAASLDLFSGETLVMPDAFRANDSSTLKRGANATFERVGDPPLTVTTGSDELAIAGWRVTDAPICECVAGRIG